MVRQNACCIRLLFISFFGVLPVHVVSACEKPVFTPLDLNTYYALAQGKSGEELKAALNATIKAHTFQTYSCIWTILEEADGDPNNSANVIGFYTGRSIPKLDRDQGGNTPDAWNREHIWANSKGFPDRDMFAYSDAHHLRATDKSVNADRASNDFAYGGTPHVECIECKLGNGTWEVPDRVKGDTARMMFYMAVRYEGSDNSNSPDLELVDRLTTTGEPFSGKLCDLMQWHSQDPVSAEEQFRNDVVYRWQGNRNPFIDHPEYAVAIWGQSCATMVDGSPAPVMPLWSLLILTTLLLLMLWYLSHRLK